MITTNARAVLDFYLTYLSLLAFNQAQSDLASGEYVILILSSICRSLAMIWTKNDLWSRPMLVILIFDLDQFFVICWPISGYLSQKYPYCLRCVLQYSLQIYRTPNKTDDFFSPAAMSMAAIRYNVGIPPKVYQVFSMASRRGREGQQWKRIHKEFILWLMRAKYCTALMHTLRILMNTPLTNRTNKFRWSEPRRRSDPGRAETSARACATALSVFQPSNRARSRSHWRQLRSTKRRLPSCRPRRPLDVHQAPMTNVTYCMRARLSPELFYEHGQWMHQQMSKISL